MGPASCGIKCPKRAGRLALVKAKVTTYSGRGGGDATAVVGAGASLRWIEVVASIFDTGLDDTQAWRNRVRVVRANSEQAEKEHTCGYM